MSSDIPLDKIDCEAASYAVCGVLETQGGVVGEEGLGGVGVRSFTSSFGRPASGLKGTSPAPRKPPRTFSSPREAKKAFLNAAKNSTFVIWVTCVRIRFSISLPYDRFKGLKHPTSSGWSRCDECAGI